MWFMTSDTLKNFDQFRNTYFKEKIQTSKTNKIKLIPKKTVAKLIIIPACILGLYYSNQIVKKWAFKNGILNRTTNHMLESWWTMQKQRWYKMSPKWDGELATNLYLSKLQSDYNYLLQRNSIKRLSTFMESDIECWIFNINPRQTTIEINEYGDLLKIHTKSKLKIGSLRFFSQKNSQLLNRETIFASYESMQTKNTDSIVEQTFNNCKTLNFNFFQQNQINDNVKQCQQKGRVIANKMQKIIKKRLEKQKKTK